MKEPKAVKNQDKKPSKQSELLGYIAIAGIAVLGSYYLITDPMWRQNILLFNFMVSGVVMCAIVVVSKLLGKAKKWRIEGESGEKFFWATGPVGPIFNALIISCWGSFGILFVYNLFIKQEFIEWLIAYLLLLGTISGVIILIDRIIGLRERKQNQRKGK